MVNLAQDCSLHVLSSKFSKLDFDCGNTDLNEFFKKDALKYQEELLGETYFFKHKSSGDIVSMFTLSNDSIKVFDLPNSRKKKVKQTIPREKSMKSFPALLIGRLGVNEKYKRDGVGSQTLDFIKSYALLEFKNRCRFLLVDSYNSKDALAFYEKNEFWYVFSSEEQERDYYLRDKKQQLRTRFMCFDLMEWKKLMIA